MSVYYNKLIEMYEQQIWDLQEELLVATPVASPDKSLELSETVQRLVEWNHQDYRGE